MHTSSRLIAAGASAAAAALILAGCSGDSGGGNSGAATGDPIHVSAVSSLAFFPEAPEAVQAVFDDYNAAGGFNGRPIEYDVLDDQIDPAASATAAQDVLSSDAIALVGSSSLLDCQINAGSWDENGIVSIQGTGVYPYCFTSANIAPTNSGPYFGAFGALTYGSETLGYNHICAAYTPDSPAIQAAFEQAFDQWALRHPRRRGPRRQPGLLPVRRDRRGRRRHRRPLPASKPDEAGLAGGRILGAGHRLHGDECRHG